MECSVSTIGCRPPWRERWGERETGSSSPSLWSALQVQFHVQMKIWNVVLVSCISSVKDTRALSKRYTVLRWLLHPQSWHRQTRMMWAKGKQRHSLETQSKAEPSPSVTLSFEWLLFLRMTEKLQTNANGRAPVDRAAAPMESSPGPVQCGPALVLLGDGSCCVLVSAGSRSSRLP